MTVNNKHYDTSFIHSRLFLHFVLLVFSIALLFHSHKKRKDSLEGSLDRALFAAELEFPKILVRRLPKHTSNVNIECAGKSE